MIWRDQKDEEQEARLESKACTRVLSSLRVYGGVMMMMSCLCLFFLLVFSCSLDSKETLKEALFLLGDASKGEKRKEEKKERRTVVR